MIGLKPYTTPNQSAKLRLGSVVSAGHGIVRGGVARSRWNCVALTDSKFKVSARRMKKQRGEKQVEWRRVSRRYRRGVGAGIRRSRSVAMVISGQAAREAA
jgi:hypothetical protein